MFYSYRMDGRVVVRTKELDGPSFMRAQQRGDQTEWEKRIHPGDDGYEDAARKAGAAGARG